MAWVEAGLVEEAPGEAGGQARREEAGQVGAGPGEARDGQKRGPGDQAGAVHYSLYQILHKVLL